PATRTKKAYRPPTVQSKPWYCAFMLMTGLSSACGPTLAVDPGEPVGAQAQEEPEPQAERSEFFAVADVETAASFHGQPSNGDLWPSCWGADDGLYAA